MYYTATCPEMSSQQLQVEGHISGQKRSYLLAKTFSICHKMYQHYKTMLFPTTAAE